MSYRICHLLALCLILLNLFPVRVDAAPEPLTACTTPPVTIMNIGFGGVVECAIDIPGNFDLYRFSGTANTVVLLSLLDLTGGCGDVPFPGGIHHYPCPVADLYAPGNNTTPFLTLGPSTDSQEVLLPSSGTYTIRIKENGDDDTESYRIGLERLFPASPTATSLCFGCSITDETIDPTPDQDFYLFDGAQDAVVTLTLTDLTGGCGDIPWPDGIHHYPCPMARLFGPDQALVTTLGPSTASQDILLPQTGTYTVRVFEYGNDDNETYNLGLQCFFPPPGCSTCNCNQPPVTCNGLTPTIVGTPGNDILVGTEGDDVIVGLGGNDRISGLGGNDVICGDSDQGGAGADTLIGGAGNDQLFGNGGVNALFGDDGDDILKGGSSRDVLVGGAGNDTLDALGGDDVLIGGAGNDVFKGGGGSNDVCDKKAEDLVPSKGCEIKDYP